MDKESFTKLIAEIFVYFRSDKMPTPQQVEYWYRDCGHIPEAAIKTIKSDIYRDKESIPRNIPKAINEAYGTSPKQYSTVIYDKTEDSLFPVDTMKSALVILQTNGDKAFMDFCHQTKMPTNDIDRVMTKHLVIKGEIKIDTQKIKNVVASKMLPMRPDIADRMMVLERQKEIILRQPGEEG
jgi:hypothetical protein